jgi:hypothetical protein
MVYYIVNLPGDWSTMREGLLYSKSSGGLIYYEGRFTI